MPLQCIVLSGSICSQHAIELILVSQNTRLESDSNDSRIMCILCKTKKLSILFTFLSEREQSIAPQILLMGGRGEDSVVW